MLTARHSGGASRAAAFDLVVLLATAALCAWASWGMWPDALADWGQHLYTAWRVQQGNVLYRDIVYYQGPLSVYFSAALFHIFGVNQHVLWYANLTILTGIIVMLYALFRALSGRLVAVICGVTFIVVFAFPQYVLMGNYNYVTPYSQEMTHGLALDLAAICILLRYQRAGRLIQAASMGGLLGLCLLTRAEPALAGVSALAAGIGLSLWTTRAPARTVFRTSITFVLAMLLPVTVAFLLLQRVMPVETALRGIAGSWMWMFDRRITQLSFYKAAMGTDYLGENLLSMGKWSALYLFLLAATMLASKVVRQSDDSRRNRRNARAAAVATALPLYLWVQFGQAQLRDALRPLPIVILIVIAMSLWKLRKIRDAEAATIPVLRITLLVLALALLLKIIFFARVWHYGFVLAMPGTLLFIEALIGWLPSELTKRGWSGATFRGAWVGLCIGFVFACLHWTQDTRRHDWASIGSGGDAFASLYWRGGGEVRDVLRDIDRLTEPDQTLAVLPSGSMLNYLSRRRHPNRYVSVLQPEFIHAGEENVLAEYQLHPPDYVVLYEMAGDSFTLQGDMYGERFVTWIRDHYQTVKRDPGAFHFELLRRRDQAR